MIRKRISNVSEQRLYDEIVGVTSIHRAHIYRKIRIADVIDIDQLSTRAAGRYALQSHFDFCICDEDHHPVFAIEFDGGGHDGKDDSKKNAIAQQAYLALFRIDERLLNRTLGGVTFLQYLVHTYFLGQAFLEMQERGELGPSEPFIMSSFLQPGAKNIFDSEFDFSRPARGRLDKIMRRGGAVGSPLNYLNISRIMFGTSASSFIGFASVPVGTKFVFGRARLHISAPCLGRPGEFPFGWSTLGDYCEGMTLEDLCDELEASFGNGGHVLRTRQQVESEIGDLMASGYSPLQGFGGKDDRLWSFINSKSRLIR